MSGRQAVALVARREITERIFEKSFLISTLITLVVIGAVAILPNALGLGGQDEYTISVSRIRAPRPSPTPRSARRTRSTPRSRSSTAARTRR
jgi:hypothetical protein